MIPSSELEMAVNNTYASIVNEIQLSNLNFTIQMTPFASYITLKKSVQKDINGLPVMPSPPLLLLLQKAQQQILHLENENSRIKQHADILEKKLENTVIKNEDLVNSLEKANKLSLNFNITKDILTEKLEIAEDNAVDLKKEIIVNENKLKELRKKHAEDMKHLELRVKDLENEKKGFRKEIHDTNRTLDNTRAALKSCKSEKSNLKTCKTSLEAKIRKFELEKLKVRKEVNHVKSKTLDGKANCADGSCLNSKPVSNMSSHSSFPSMISHWTPHCIKSFQQPSDLSTMIAHCSVLPPTESTLLSISEVLEELNKAVEKLSASMECFGSSKNF